jgi:selenocysteine lyase/cysteine desulfurase
MNTQDNGIVYLNNAAMARLSQNVKQAGIHAISNQFEHDDSVVMSIRKDFATIIGVDDETCVAIMPSTAYAITFAAKNLAPLWTSGKILLLQDQMCSAVYPWQEICDRSNGSVVLEIVPYPEQTETWTELILKRLGPGASILAACLPPLHWSDGALIDLVTVGNACFDLNIPLIVDATQAAGAVPLSVPRIRPALLACSVHKWLRAPSGVCLVCVNPALHDQWKPLDQNGRGRDFGDPDWDSSKDMMGPTGYPTQFFQDARKFDGGGKPNPILLPMLRESLKSVVSIDTSELQARLKEVTQPLVDWIHSIDAFFLPTSHGFHLLGIRPREPYMTTDQIIEVCKRLQSEFGIYTTVRCGALRISPYVDNTKDDIEELVAALKIITGM